MRISFAELGLNSLDKLSADSLALFVNTRERPMQGLAGLCDWRLCGQLSRVLQAGFFEGKGGEALLMPTAHRFGAARLLVFGLGETGIASEAQVSHAFEAIGRAGARSLALSIDAFGETPEAAASVWLRVSRASAFERQCLLGDPRALPRLVKAAVGEDRSFHFDGESVAPVAGQRRA